MSVAWNDVFRLPAVALAGRRVPKAALLRNAHLTRLEQKALDKVDRLEHFATVQKSTTRIPPYIGDGRVVQSIVFLRCEMTDSRAYFEMGGLLHKCFQNPTVLLFENGEEVCLSCAVTRMSLAERGVTVVEDVSATGGFRLADPRFKPLLGLLALNELPQGDLYKYLSELSWRIRLGRLVGTLGFYPTCAPTQRPLLLELIRERDSLTAERNSLAEQRRDRSLTLDETARLRIKQHDIEGRIEDLLGEINTTCLRGATS